MLKITETEVFGWKAAIRGMRNAHESWDKSDSGYCLDTLACHNCKWNRLTEVKCKTNIDNHIFVVGKDDFTLMKKLVAAGTDHSKFMRMIHVQCDWEAPLYWWKEADTYKVGTVRNSCSTMHKITEHEFDMDMFSHEHLFDFCPSEHHNSTDILEIAIEHLNAMRKVLNSLDQDDPLRKEYWWQLIQLLPSSYNQKATMDLNYQVLRNMYHARKHHKQDEWRVDFCNWVKSLPYSELITMTKEELLESIKEE
jgi:hypothetical protein